MDHAALYTFLAGFAHLAIAVGLSIRVLAKRHPTGVSMAWIVLTFALPYVGAVLYLLIGERPLGRRRDAAAASLLPVLQSWISGLPSQPQRLPRHDRWEAIRRTAHSMVRIPSLRGNRLHLMRDSEKILTAIAADIEQAEHSVLMEFYIWESGGSADRIAEALIRAAARGIACRLLLDAVGSRDFFRGYWPDRMKTAGVEIIEALPVGLLRTLFVRFDIRLHRKIVVIDGAIGYTGSLNLIDPREFRQDAGVGEWVDAMARVEGPVVEVLASIFLWDWCIETGAAIGNVAPGLEEIQPPAQEDDAEVQVLPSGPGFEGEGAHRLLLAALYAAREEIVLTTPYFVPDEALCIALESAARRGVAVSILVPRKVDSRLVRHASRSFFDTLNAAGVNLFLFDGGLLHTKSVTVDHSLALFGTTNLDMRSFRLNFEITLVVYDEAFTGQLRRLQSDYFAHSTRLDARRWAARPAWTRIVDNAARLASPLL